MKTLQEKIEARLSHLAGEKAIYIKELHTGSIISINAEHEFHAASIIKLFYLFEALKQVDSGRIQYNSMYKLAHDEKVGGAGVLSLLHDDMDLSLEDLLQLMIDISDNTATNMLFDILGKENINGSIKEIGIKNTFVARKLMRVIPGLYSYTTARDAGLILEEFVKPLALGQSSAQKACEILEKQQLNDCLSYYLNVCGKCGSLLMESNICPSCNTSISDLDPIAIPFQHKTGEINGVVHDAGILYINNKPYIIVMLTKNLESNIQAKKCMHDIGIMVYNYFNNAEEEDADA